MPPLSLLRQLANGFLWGYCPVHQPRIENGQWEPCTVWRFPRVVNLWGGSSSDGCLVSLGHRRQGLCESTFPVPLYPEALVGAGQQGRREEKTNAGQRYRGSWRWRRAHSEPSARGSGRGSFIRQLCIWGSGLRPAVSVHSWAPQA